MKNGSNRRKSMGDDFTFTVRSEPLPAELRPEWRISLLLLVISRCGWGGSMPLRKAHLICSSTHSEESRALLLRMLEGDRHLDDIPVRIDPSLNRAIDYAIAEKLISAEVKSGTFAMSLLPLGRQIVDKIVKTKDCLIEEKQFVEKLRGRLPNDKVDEILNWEATL